MASIRLERLTKDFGGGVIAVNDLDLDIADGEFLAFLGPSGCGKTTTMNMISGLERPTQGELYFDDEPVSHVPPGKRRVGFVFQNYAIFTHMTVYGNLAFGLRVAKPRPGKAEIDREVRKVARVVGVADILEQRAGRLSVNDMQKVALGRSMIVDPSIFLLDEPFSNLDAAFRSYMRAELKRIQHEIGQTMIYVTHDQVEAMGMADRVAVMNAGVLQQVGTPPEIYSKPANTFVARFAGSTLINFLPASAVPGYQRNGRPITIAVRPEHVRIVPDDSPDAVLVASVKVIEPLGAKDVVHLSFGDHELRAIGSPGQRPSVGERVGLAFVEQSVLRFNAETGAAVD